MFRIARSLTFSLTLRLTLGLTLLTSGHITCLACGGYPSDFMEIEIKSELARDAAFDPETVAALRSSGYAALDELANHQTTIEERLVSLSRLPSASRGEQAEYVALTQQLQRLGELIDAVGGQRNCTTSGLFWHTDLDQALAEAKRTNKPVLSLRMLGKLTDEYSCANSRFFRTALYSNQEISATLREKFILHWKSVRPVPRVTIDFGDGRTLERTLTGNSAHYLLDATGRPLDCLPGLYGPGAFQQWLDRSVGVNKFFAQLPHEERDAWLKQYHRMQNEAAGRRLQTVMQRVDPTFLARWNGQEISTNDEADEQPPHAQLAAAVAVTKGISEIPILNLAFGSGAVEKLEGQMDEAMWERLAAEHADWAQLDEASINVMRNENARAIAAGQLTETKRKVEDPLLRLVEGFQRSILIDTVRNEYLLHRRIHEWFAAAEPIVDIEPLNRRVYAQLFLTPDSDPWLGLKPDNVYTALENDGVKDSVGG